MLRSRLLVLVGRGGLDLLGGLGEIRGRRLLLLELRDLAILAPDVELGDRDFALLGLQQCKPAFDLGFDFPLGHGLEQELEIVKRDLGVFGRDRLGLLGCGLGRVGGRRRVVGARQ